MSSVGFLIGAGMLCMAACARNSTSSSPAAIPTAADCPGVPVVRVTNPTSEAVDVLTASRAGRSEVLGIVDPRATVTFTLPTTSAGRVHVRWSSSFPTGGRRPDLRSVQVLVRCA